MLETYAHANGSNHRDEIVAKRWRGSLRVKPQDRLIVALDVPTGADALRMVDELHGLVSFYKVGLELLMAGEMGALLRALTAGHKVFVDLKLPNDIPETVRRVVGLAADLGVSFLTLSNSATPDTIASAIDGRGANRIDPKLLFVPLLSSMNRAEFSQHSGRPESSFESLLEERTSMAKSAGVDGFIVSGQEIGLLRSKYPRSKALLVSPGIRPTGAPKDDHKRSCTPAEAMRLGADYIVVGRPIRDAPSRKDATKRIIDEIAEAQVMGGT
jgi:orotidine-5'-phosphate decarboxylase